MPFSVKKWTEDEDKNERCLDTLLLKNPSLRKEEIQQKEGCSSLLVWGMNEWKYWLTVAHSLSLYAAIFQVIDHLPSPPPPPDSLHHLYPPFYQDLSNYDKE